MDTDLEDTGRRDVRPNFETVDLVNLPPGSLPPLRNAHVPSVLRSLTESSESASLPSAETYLSIFISSKQAQQYSSIPKYICNLLCVILLMTKLSRNSRYITWFLVILPLFISNTISFCEKLSEVHFILVTQEQDEFSLSRAFRPIASIIDILGSFYTKLVLCTYLSYGYSISLNEISLLIPLWITFGLASLLRFTAKDLTSESNRSVRSTSTQTRLVLLFGLTFLFLQRVAQPLLILLKLGDKLSERTHWSIVFGPSWVTLFFVLACSLLLISFAPLISSHGNQTLRDVTKILIYLLASRLAVGAICSIIFLVLLSERLDYYESSNIHGSDVSINRILLPLVVFFLFLLVIQPLVMQTTVKYQETLAAMVLQRQNRPGSSASSDSSSSTSVIVEKNKRNMYFLQISPTLYALCDAHGNSITLQPTKSVPQKIKELYNTFFPVKRKPRKNAVTSNSQTYSEIQQSQHTNQAIELSTFSSSISIAEDSHGSYLEEEGNEDAEEESCVILHSKELEQEIQLILRGMEEQNVETVSPKLSSGSSFQYTQCVVCLNNIANGIIYDCGHAVTCLACGISIARKPPGHCPICRATITSLLEMSTKPFPLDTQKVMTISRCGYTFHTNHPLASTGHSTHHSMLSMPHRQLLPTNGHMITNTISNFAANQSLNTQQDSILDILMN